MPWACLLQVEQLLLLGENVDEELQEMYNSLTEVRVQRCSTHTRMYTHACALCPVPALHKHSAAR